MLLGSWTRSRESASEEIIFYSTMSWSDITRNFAFYSGHHAKELEWLNGKEKLSLIK